MLLREKGGEGGLITHRGDIGGIEADSLPMWVLDRIEATGRRHRLRHTPHPSYTVYTIAERDRRRLPLHVVHRQN